MGNILTPRQVRMDGERRDSDGDERGGGGGLVYWGGTRPGPFAKSNISRPSVSAWSEANKIKFVCSGENHLLFLTKDGKIYTSDFSDDSSEYGFGSKPQPVSLLDSYHMTLISCGADHSHAVNDWGQVFSWGAGDFGQLGLGKATTHQPTPKIIREIATMQVAQIACGYYHSMALMSNGELYSWGNNECGQLGLGTTDSQSSPKLVKSLIGVPFSHIACGGYHTMAVTKSGAVFAWGKNQHGQLGLNDTEDRYFPTLLKNFRSMNICRVVCGEDHSVFLSLDGGVFACGSNSYGQLGHGDDKDEHLPKKILELMGSQVVQVACGRTHLLVATASGRLQACGNSEAGQLGIDTQCSYITTPRPVYMPWELPKTYESIDRDNMKVYRIFGGGNRCFVTLSGPKEPLYDARGYSLNTQILTINVSNMEACAVLKEGDQVDQDLLCYLETVFKSLSCYNSSFLSAAHYNCNIKNCGVNFEHAERVFKIISGVENKTIKEVILQSISEMLGKSINENPPDVEALRYFLTIALYHEVSNPRHWNYVQIPLAKALASLKQAPLKLLTSWFHEIPKHCFERLIISLKSVISHYFIAQKQNMRMDSFPVIMPIFKALERLNAINECNAYLKRASPETFYISDLAEFIDVKMDYFNWLQSEGNKFFFCDYPFLFDALCKTSILELDQWMQMHLAINQALTISYLAESLGREPPPKLLHLTVSRENIVEDTLREISNKGTVELKKPLKVKFQGEEAEDSGGVRKEFFLLLLREILDPKYGMFKYYPDSRCIWFAEDSFEDAIMFHLIGLLCGLAIYNFIIINVSFPSALYKKLLKAPLTLDDLKELDPTLAQSLQNVLDYDGVDFEDIFDLRFEITREVYGEVKNYALKENGGEITVNNENKVEFVELYIDYIFNKSIAKQFSEFYSGFYKVCGGRVFQLFQPHELMELVVGKAEYNWIELENAASYRGGYKSSDPAIVAFWEVFYELPESDKKKFLYFLTGCDRVPIHGMKSIKITIQPTSDDRFLPVAHTCFNLLDLPRYSTKEKLRYKLLQAIEQKEGFSLV